MPKARDPSDFLPRWSKYKTTDSKGRDPLGLSRVTHHISDSLLNGVITTTDRARYYTFYTWCLWHIAQHERPTRGPAFVDALQRRESAMVIATLLQDPAASVIGKMGQAFSLVAVTGAGSRVDTQFRCLPSSRLGGYGQYFRGVIHALGLRQTNEQGIDFAHGEAAEVLARTFQSQVQRTPYIAKQLFLKSEIPIADLKASAPSFGLQSLDDTAAKDERQLLSDVLWNEGRFAQDRRHELAWNRKNTLALMFANLEAYRAAGIPVAEEELDFQLLIAPCYFGQLIDLEEEEIRTKSYAPPQHLLAHSNLWAQFVLHNYVTFAFEYALQSLLQCVGAADGLELREVRDRLLFDGLREHLTRLCATTVDRPADLMQVPEGKVDALRNFTHPRSENFLLMDDDEKPSPVTTMAHALALMSTIGLRWRDAAGSAPVRLVAERCAANNLWLGSVLDLTKTWPTATWEEALDALLQCVVNNHDRVMYEKHNLDAWVQRVGKRYRAEQDVIPHMRSSRWWQTLRICRDLQLIVKTDDRLEVTPLGRRRLAAALAEGKT